MKRNIRYLIWNINGNWKCMVLKYIHTHLHTYAGMMMLWIHEIDFALAVSMLKTCILINVIIKLCYEKFIEKKHLNENAISSMQLFQSKEIEQISNTCITLLTLKMRHSRRRKFWFWRARIMTEKLTVILFEKSNHSMSNAVIWGSAFDFASWRLLHKINKAK